MGLEEGSSTDALVTSSRILNFSWRGYQNTLSLLTNTSHHLLQSCHHNSVNRDLQKKLTKRETERTFLCVHLQMSGGCKAIVLLCVLYSLHVGHLFLVFLWFWLQFLYRKQCWRCTGLEESGCWIGSVWRDQTWEIKENINIDTAEKMHREGFGSFVILPSGKSEKDPQEMLCSEPHAEVVNSGYRLSEVWHDRKFLLESHGLILHTTRVK